jgi:citrate/tricarballylate utilization protein
VLYGIFTWSRSGMQFWSETEAVDHAPLSFLTLASAAADALGLGILRGGGPGCYYPGEKPSASRRICHALVFWGFLSDLVSTSLAFIYQDLMHWQPPYPITSAPVIFGSVGGMAILVGVCGLIWFKAESDRAPSGKGAYGLDYTFLIMLGLTALTGMLTLTLRGTTALGSLLVIHLALVAALFFTAPYGKFVHALYRVLALIRYHVEEHRPAHNA